MIVDDEPASAEYVLTILARYAPEHEICAMAGDGVEALSLMEESRPDLVITDVAMPRMNGLELVKAITQRYSEVRAIIVSGYQEFEYARTALRYGVLDYILKPVNARGLINSVNQIAESILAEKASLRDRETPDMPDAPARDALFTSLENYVTKRLPEQITLSSLCRHCGVSQSTANRIFRKHTGMTFLEYLTTRRISLARALIDKDPSLMIKEVASRCGFSDPLYFSKVFKSATGLTPSEYAKRA